MSFALLTSEEKKKYAPEVISDANLVSYVGKQWIVKPQKENSIQYKEAVRDLLCYQLGKSFANIAEVKFINPDEFVELRELCKLPENYNKQNTYLIRLADSYILDELVCKNLEEAVATELIFSLWVRRRDTHANNRSYINGIPIFFDHHVTLGNEKNYSAEEFFSAEGSDLGRAGLWRVINYEGMLTTSILRKNLSPFRSKTWQHHYINDREQFIIQLDIKAKLLPELVGNDWKALISETELPEDQVDLINNFLKLNLERLVTDIEIMKNTIFQI